MKIHSAGCNEKLGCDVLSTAPVIGDAIQRVSEGCVVLNGIVIVGSPQPALRREPRCWTCFKDVSHEHALTRSLLSLGVIAQGML